MEQVGFFSLAEVSRMKEKLPWGETTSDAGVGWAETAALSTVG